MPPLLIVHRPSSPCSTRALTILTSSSGLSSAPVLTKPSFFTVLSPLFTRPKMVCFPSNHGVGASVMKNCDPLVLGPELAILRIPAPVCFRSERISSSNFSPHIEEPPRPVPVGSPPWICEVVLFNPYTYATYALCTTLWRGTPVRQSTGR